MWKVAGNCVDWLVEGQLIPAEDRDIYFYGFEVLFSMGGSLMAAIILGGITGHLPETMAFLAAFLPIRCCIGGYHAPTPGSCFLLSAAIAAPAVYFGGQLWTVMVPPIVALVIALVFALAPVIHPNHPHSARRVLVLKHRARIACVVEGAAILMSCLFLPQQAAIMALAFLVAGLGMPVAIWCGQAVPETL